MKSPNDQEVLSGIRSHDSRILKHVYETYYPITENYVRHNQGSADQARDVFQEAMIVVYKRVRSGSLVLSCKFGTYLYGVCKKIWIQERRKYLLRSEKLRQHGLVVEDPGPVEDPLLEEHLRKIFNRHFAELSPDCKKILSLYFNHFKLEEIREAMEYTDLHHTADRKYRCKKSLMKRIVNDPLFKRLKDEQP